jgi:hypothetical protein
MTPMDDELDEMARQVIDGNRYMTMGTAGPDGRPRVSPVYFTHVGYRDFYWVSSPDAHHSRNIAERGPAISLVIFDSTAEIGQGRAVYVDADAAQVPDEELAARCAEAFPAVAPGAVRFTPADLSGDAQLRLYRAGATCVEVHIPGRDPRYGTGIDSRRRVNP